uniref:PA domain-containing protein n=1 Tax=Dokdonella sp. TaxID=2291710 RepID=UPI002608607B
MKLIKPTIMASAVGVALVGAGAGTLNAAGTIMGVDAVDAAQDAVAESEAGRYIVTFAEPGLVRYNGGVQGLARTAPGLDGVSQNSSTKFVMSAPAAQAYKAYLAEKRAAHIDAVQRKLGRTLDISFTYDVIRNGISAAMSAEEANLVAQVPGVVSVKPVRVMEPQTFRGPSFIGANTIWDGTAVPAWATASRGEGVKIGIIDTGTYIGHPSFTNDPACGFSEENPKLFPRDCTVNNGTTCTGNQPNADQNSHGVHTSSTAGGNTIDNTVTPAPLLPDGVTMSGVAPCASIYSYNVANHSNGSLAGDALDAALQNAIVDQVDVVNYSIGYTCGGGNPWSDLEFLDAAESDIFIAASAGNTRSTCTNPVGLVGNNGPWLLTVANSSQDQLAAPTLTVTGPGTVPATLQHIGLNPGSTTLIPADTTDMTGSNVKTATNVEGCTASGGIPAGTFTATDVAVVRRGNCNFSEKINNAYNAGARTIVITNNQAGTINMDTTGANAGAAAFSISAQAVGDALIAFAQANAAKGDYRRVEITPRQGDVISSGSLRGPTKAPYQDLTKPDITGPG